MRDLARVFDEDSADFKPYALHDGTPAGEVALIRQRNTDNKTLFVGMYRCPHTIESTETYEYNDSLYVLAGEVWLTTADGVEHHLKPGDMATVAKGQTATFRQSAGFKKFFVMSELTADPSRLGG